MGKHGCTKCTSWGVHENWPFLDPTPQMPHNLYTTSDLLAVIDAFKRYGRHLSGCGAMKGHICDCGFEIVQNIIAKYETTGFTSDNTNDHPVDGDSGNE